MQRELEDRQRQLQNLQQEQSALELRHETLKDQLSKLDPEVQRLRSENEMLARHSGDLAVEEQKLEGENSQGWRRITGRRAARWISGDRAMRCCSSKIMSSRTRSGSRSGG